MPFRPATWIFLLTTAVSLGIGGTPPAAYAHDVGGSYQSVGDFTYTVEMKGAPEGMEKELLGLTEAHKLQDNPPPTLYLLKRRLENDTETLKKALHAKGFYDAAITTEITTEEEPYKAFFTIIPGEVYILESVQIVEDPRGKTKDIPLPDPSTLQLQLGGPVNYEKILAARPVLRDKIHAMTCLRDMRIRSHLRVDTTSKTAEVVYRVRSGDTANFGTLTIKGLETVERPFIDRKVTWEQGECYKPSKVQGLQVSLLQSNLFSTSEMTVEEEPNADGQVDMVLNVTERKHRTIKAGIGFATEEGLDFKPAWEHRNFMGQGEKVVLEGTLSTFIQSVKGRFERPDFMRKGQTLVLQSELAQSETDAYDSTSLSTLAQITRPLADKLTGGLGVAYALKRVDDDGGNSGEETFSLVSFPGFVEHNTRNSDLDATKGHLLRADVEPFIETLNNGAMFVKTQAAAKWYHQHESVLFEPTWAFRASLGSIWGSANLDIPADERFYSGGGGSVRGYGFQMLGPLQNGSPTGGRSLVEFSGELRLRVSESFGVVPFVDAGNVYSDVYPKFDGDLFYAAGLGIRYYTDFGPFRFDVAMPLDRRNNVDDSFQLYLSFGQAF